MPEQTRRVRDLFPDGELQRADFVIEVRRISPGSERGEGGDKADERLFEVAISSETEIERWFGLEVLDHSRAAVDLTRLRNGAAVLVDHRGDQIGVVEPGSARVDGDRVLRAGIASHGAPAAKKSNRTWRTASGGASPSATSSRTRSWSRRARSPAETATWMSGG